MPNSRTQSIKKQDNLKSAQDNNDKKKKAINKSKQMYISDAPPSLSIEERVKLRRTIPIQTSTKPITIKKSSSSKINHTIKKDIKQNRLSKTKKNLIIKPKKFFLGSGLDLDNIVLGNRQRRSVQT